MSLQPAVVRHNTWFHAYGPIVIMSGHRSRPLSQNINILISTFRLVCQICSEYISSSTFHALNMFLIVFALVWCIIFVFFFILSTAKTKCLFTLLLAHTDLLTLDISQEHWHPRPDTLLFLADREFVQAIIACYIILNTIIRCLTN